MSTTYNTVIFLEFYRSRDVVLSGGKRSPQYRWQNFFEEPVSLFVGLVHLPEPRDHAERAASCGPVHARFRVAVR